MLEWVTDYKLHRTLHASFEGNDNYKPPIVLLLDEG